MGETNKDIKVIGEDVKTHEEAQEREQVEELERCVDGLKTLSKAFSSFATSDELAEAEGKRCILAITGLKHTKKIYFFEVTGSSLHDAKPYQNYNTLILAPIDSTIRVFREVARGNKWAWHEEYARGRAKIKGQKHLHDYYALGEAFKRFAELCKRYGPVEL